MTRIALLFPLVIGSAMVSLGSAFAAPKKAVPAAANIQVDHGRLVFQRACAPCHGQGVGDDGPKYLPGTAALDRKYKGELPPQLELRKDLDADIIRTFIRHGSGAMPMFRKTEVSDADVEAIAAYIAANSGKTAAKKK